MKDIKLSNSISYTITISEKTSSLEANLKGTATTEEVALFSAIFLQDVLKGVETAEGASPDALIKFAEAKEVIDMLVISGIANIKEMVEAIPKEEAKQS